MQQRLTQDLTQFLASLPEDDRIKAINEIRMAIHQVSPFREEPVDCVLWAEFTIQVQQKKKYSSTRI
ncbi:ibrB domain protein [Escherichia coli]|nr:ibrB domain protein [Escherichia coli]